jgi:hypothetical protein
MSLPQRSKSAVSTRPLQPLTNIATVVHKRRAAEHGAGRRYGTVDVMKVTRPEFEKWPATIERQSDMTATLEIPPPFEMRQIGMEGTGEPFIARVFLGLIDMASNIFSQQDKNAFDERFAGTLNSVLELRKTLVSIRKRQTALRGTVEVGHR